MVNVIGVRFKPAGKTYYFDPLDFDIKQGDSVIVETSRGIEYGEVVMSKKTIDNDQFKKPLKGVIRIATEEDTEKSKRNRELEKEAYKICLEKIQNHKLEMKLVEVEYTFDGNKILFEFVPEKNSLNPGALLRLSEKYGMKLIINMSKHPFIKMPVENNRRMLSEIIDFLSVFG